MKMSRIIVAIVVVLMSCLVTSAENPSTHADVNLTGTWQLSWEGRIGTERGILQLQQNGDAITGKLQNHMGHPSVSGSIHGRNVSLNIAFESAHPFTIAFTGAVEGGVEAKKMSGKFEIQGMTDGYDWHGENAHNTNYSWTASREVRPSSQTQTTAERTAPSSSR